MNDTECFEKEAQDRERTTKMDPELRAIGQMLRILEELEPQGRARAVAYLMCRYQKDQFPLFEKLK